MRIVIKIGTSTLAYSTGHLNIRHIEKLCKVVSDVKNAGEEIILVSSGAVGMGVVDALMTDPACAPLKEALGLGRDSCVLLFSTEGDTDPERYRKIVWDGAWPT